MTARDIRLFKIYVTHNLEELGFMFCESPTAGMGIMHLVFLSKLQQLSDVTMWLSRELCEFFMAMTPTESNWTIEGRYQHSKYASQRRVEYMCESERCMRT